MIKKLFILLILVALAGSAFAVDLAPNCSRCSGNGKCWSCGGTGTNASAACYMCNGTGKCWYCGGRGTTGYAPEGHAHQEI